MSAKYESAYPGAAGRLVRKLAELIALVAETQKPAEVFQPFISKLTDATQSSSGAIYVLNKEKSEFVCHHTENYPGHNGQIKVSGLGSPDERQTTRTSVAYCIAENKTISHSQTLSKASDSDSRMGRAARIIVPIRSGRGAIGAVDLQAVGKKSFTSLELDFVRAAANLLSETVTKQHVYIMLQEMHAPIDYRCNEYDFYKELVGLAARAMCVQKVAIRELSDGKLKCLAISGFPDASLSDFDFAIPKGPFKEVLNDGRLRVESGKVLRSVENSDRYISVKTFAVVGICVGDETFGCLSVASDFDYPFTQIELHGLQSLANAIGIAIHNFRNFHARGEELYNLARAFTDSTALEVAQSARHIAKAHIGTQRELLSLIDISLSKGKQQSLAKGREYIKKADAALTDILLAVEQIKEATKPIKSELHTIQLRQLWDDAISLVGGRIQLLKIRPQITGNAEVTVYPDFLRHAFLHILSNSIDSFRNRNRKRGKIEIVISHSQGKEPFAIITYQDDAGGADMQALARKTAPSPPVGEDLFRKGLSTKDDGSGYGMFLARRAIAKHNGSITVVNFPNPLRFEIKIPLDTNPQSLVLRA